MDTTALHAPRATPRHRIASVFASAWQSQRRRGAVWPWMVLVLAAAGLLQLDVLLPPGTPVKLLRGVATVLLSSLALGVWLVFVFNVLQQNHPQWARLVPGHVGALRRALYIGAAAVSLYAASLAAWAGWSWAATALIVAPLCAATACALRWSLLWLLPVIAATTLPWQRELGLLQALAQVWHDWPWALAAGVLAATMLALRSAVLTGLAGHAQAQVKLAATAAMARGDTPKVAHRKLSAGWLGPVRWGDWTYSAWMRRLLAQPHASVGARLALGMGPSAHWSGVFANTLYVVLLFALLLVLRALFPEWRTLQAGHSGLLIGVAFTGMLVPLQLPNALWATRREQALLALLPGTPTGAALNRWLALRLAALDLAVLLGVMGAIAAFGDLGPANPTFPRIDQAALSALVLGLLITPGLWRDWARAGAPSGRLQWVVIGASVLVGGLAMAWTYGYERRWYEVIVWTALIGVPLAVWRWRRLRRLPSAWPVGRMRGQAAADPP